MQTKHAKTNRMRRLMQAGILLCLLMMAGCASDESLLDNENLSQNLSSEMKLVKDKFDKQYYTGLQTRTTSEELKSMFTDLKPEWENAIEEENEDEKVTLIPIRVKAMKLTLSEECFQKYEITKDQRYLNTRTLLCFKVNKKTKREDFFFMSFVPSEMYLVKKNFDLTNNFYFKRDKNYDGKVIYHDINSNFVNGWEYQNGKIIAFESPKQGENFALSTRSAGYECYPITDVYFNEYYYTVNGGEPHYNFYRIVTVQKLFCVYTNSYSGPQPAIWWIDDSDGSGKGGGGYTPPANPEPVVSKDPSLLKDPVLNKVYDCVVGDGTANNFVKDFLSRYIGKEASFNLTFTIAPLQYDDKEHVYGQFQYNNKNPNEGVITINELSLNDRVPLQIAATFIHECMHAYIHSFVYSKTNAGKVSTFDEALNEYERNITWGNRPDLTADEEHDGIALLWVKALGEELHKIHKSQDGYNKFWEYTTHDGKDDIKNFYLGIAWSGLMKTSAYESISENEKKKIAKMSEKNIVSGLSKNWDCNK